MKGNSVVIIIWAEDFEFVSTGGTVVRKFEQLRPVDSEGNNYVRGRNSCELFSSQKQAKQTAISFSGFN